jgi:DNA-binding LacI/PurR family transcriptional regulator
MPKKPAVHSIHELAAEAGVSYATVSRVLNGRGRTSEEARRRVLEAAEKHQFRPRMQARRSAIALVFNPFIDVNAGYPTLILVSLMRALAQHDVALELFTAHSLQPFRLQGLDGLLAMPWDARSRAWVGELGHSFPKVLLNDSGLPGYSTVASDHRQSGALAAEHLISRGHVRCGFLANNFATWGNAERRAGFVEAFKKAGNPIEAGLECDLGQCTALDAVNRLRQQGVSAVFVADEGRALEFVRAAKSLGLSIPGDLSVIAMETPGVSLHVEPPLSSISQPLALMAEKAVDLVISRIGSGGAAKPATLLLENTLIERESVRPVAKEP